MRQRPGRTASTLAQAEQERLADIRAQAPKAWARFLAEAGPPDALGALAFLAGIVGTTPADPADIVTAIDRARAEGHTWRQIADAMGEGATADASRRVMDRRQRWT